MCTARVHLGAFDGHYYSEDHKFHNKSRSPTFVLTYFVWTAAEYGKSESAIRTYLTLIPSDQLN